MLVIGYWLLVIGYWLLVLGVGWFVDLGLFVVLSPQIAVHSSQSAVFELPQTLGWGQGNPQKYRTLVQNKNTFGLKSSLISTFVLRDKAQGNSNSS
jgi:hypothetical protein